MDLNRRMFLGRTGLGFGSLALGSMLRGGDSGVNGLPHFAPKAKSVIWLFMRGGVSHMESFDPKPMLNQLAGKSIDETQFKYVQDRDRLKKVRVVVVNDANGQQRNKLYPLQVGYKKHGQSGIEVSDWFPHIGSCIDDIAVIRSMWTTDDNHGAQVQFHSGRHMLDPRVPTIGAWVNWGLGTLNENLPQFIGMGPRHFDRSDGHYLGPAYDEVKLKIDPRNPLDYAKPEGDLTGEEQRLGFGLVNRLNRLSRTRYPNDAKLEARIKAYELAYRMQTSVPGVVNFDAETEATKKLYGFDQNETRPFGQQLLAARRFVERGVRFIQLYHRGWDHHGGIKKGIEHTAGLVDKATAALVTDLQQRGMLDDTLIVYGGEFGRTPMAQGNGRDHHIKAFSMWLAGAGIKGGVTHGATDDLGYNAVKDVVHVHDLHATMLHLLGIPHKQLTYRFQGRDFRLTDVHGNLVKPILT